MTGHEGPRILTVTASVEVGHGGSEGQAASLRVQGWRSSISEILVIEKISKHSNLGGLDGSSPLSQPLLNTNNKKTLPWFPALPSTSSQGSLPPPSLLACWARRNITEKEAERYILLPLPLFGAQTLGNYSPRSPPVLINLSTPRPMSAAWFFHQ